ncbi:MAG: T9SS type A sorting domain-containing protein [Candidatus Cloacimonetes bacterium]|nr:T9SS type A sorting domain-containing protein [Candidatus Cloacimonadota bacterium]
MTNCTVSGNTANYAALGGGGLFTLGAPATITNCTFANNTMPNSNGGGIYLHNNTLYIKNTIIANNTASGTADFYKNSGTLTDNGYNIVETQSGSDFSTGNHDIVGEQLNLNLRSTLEDNGTLNGTKTLALYYNGGTASVAIDAGSNSGDNNGVAIPTTDQRGAERYDFAEPNVQSSTDIGAYEDWPGGDDTLPVELSTFTVQYLNNTPTLYWSTQSETDNLGWNVYRNTEENFSSSQKITDEMIQGNGTTTEPSYYIYNETSEDIIIGQTYWYWLESIDLGGVTHHYNNAVNITIPDINEDPTYLERPIVYELQSSPNPAKFSTLISFTINKSAFAEVSIYNILGKLVKTLPMVITTEDEKSIVYWNGKDEDGNIVKDGIYLYQLNLDGKAYKTNKLILLR